MTLKDFENLAKLVDGVSDAKAYDINIAPDMCLYHEVKVVIVPEKGTAANTALVSNVYNFLYERMIPPTNLQVLAPSDISVDIHVVIARDTNLVEGGIEYSVKNAIEEYFLNRSGAIGQEFNPNELSAIINQVKGVRYVNEITPNKIINVDRLSVIKLGNLNISMI